MASWFSTKTEWQYNDLPTPTTTDEYVQLESEVFTQRQEWLSRTDWTLVKESSGITIETAPIDDSDVNLVRVRGLIDNVDIANLIKQLYTPTYEQRRNLYSNCESHDVVEDRDNCQITLSEFAVGSMVSNRETLVVRFHREVDDKHYVFVQSINREDTPHKSSPVRAVARSMVAIEPTDIENQYQITSIDHVDPKGWLPSSVINSFISNSDSWLKRLRRVYNSQT